MQTFFDKTSFKHCHNKHVIARIDISGALTSKYHFAGHLTSKSSNEFQDKNHPVWCCMGLIMTAIITFIMHIGLAAQANIRQRCRLNICRYIVG